MFTSRDKTVRVTRREDLDAALRHATRVVVEGDAALTGWAVARVTGEGGAEAGPRLRAIADEDRAAHVAVGRAPNRLWPWVAAALGLAALVATAFLVERVAVPQAVRHPEFARPHGGSPPTASWAPLVWPVAFVIVAVLGFLLVRRGLASGRDVTVSWKVAQLGEGRVEFVRRAA